MNSRRRYVLLGCGVVVVPLTAVYLSGPRESLQFQPRAINVPADVGAFVAESEAKVPDLRPGVAKTIVWASPARTKTAIAIVYLHGFSATRGETAPLSERVAAHFGANLYYTRLTGHGRDGAALAAATANDWLNDSVEALAVGQRLGDHVVVIGTSTGGTLAAWLASRAGQAPHACVLLSPNFGPKDHRAEVLTWPWARKISPVVFGPTRHRELRTEMEKNCWTNEYPTTALLPMMALVKMARLAPLESIRAPVLVIYSRDDMAVDPGAIEIGFGRIGSTQKALIPLVDKAAGSHHVLAGDILGRENTDEVVQVVIGFLEHLDFVSATRVVSKTN